MSDLNVLQTNIDLIGTRTSPITLAADYSALNSGRLMIPKSEYINLGINYTMATGETANSIEAALFVANRRDDIKVKANTLAFVDSSPDTITDSGNGFVTAGFSAGQRIEVRGSASNDGFYTIETVAAGTLTLISTDTLTTETAGANATIKSECGQFYRLTNEAESTGTITLTHREYKYAAVSAAVTYDRINIELKNLPWDMLRVYVKETGKASTFGFCWVEASTLGN